MWCVLFARVMTTGLQNTSRTKYNAAAGVSVALPDDSGQSESARRFV